MKRWVSGVEWGWFVPLYGEVTFGGGGGVVVVVVVVVTLAHLHELPCGETKCFSCKRSALLTESGALMALTDFGSVVINNTTLDT